MAERRLSNKVYLKREFLEGVRIDPEMEEMMKEVNKKLEANENYPYLRTNASDCY